VLGPAMWNSLPIKLKNCCLPALLYILSNGAILPYNEPSCIEIGSFVLAVDNSKKKRKKAKAQKSMQTSYFNYL